MKRGAQIFSWPNTTTPTPTGTAGVASMITVMGTAARRPRAGQSQLRRITGSWSTPTPTRTRQTRLHCGFRQLLDGRAMAPARPVAVDVRNREARHALVALPTRAVSRAVSESQRHTAVGRRTSDRLWRRSAVSLNQRETGKTPARARPRTQCDGTESVETDFRPLPEKLQARARAGLYQRWAVSWHMVCRQLDRTDSGTRPATCR